MSKRVQVLFRARAKLEFPRIQVCGLSAKSVVLGLSLVFEADVAVDESTGKIAINT